MLRRALLLALPMSLALASAGPALADTTIGQTGTPNPGSGLAGGIENVNPSALVPAAGTITNFQTQAAISDVCASLGTGVYDFQALRPEGNNRYLVLGDMGNQTDPCDGQLHSYPVSISVQAGDVLGVYVVQDWAGLLSGGSRQNGSGPEPAVGQTVTLPNSGSDTTDLAATLKVQSDSDLALTGVPADVTADATAPSGAVITYTPPTALDEEPAQVTCSPATGTTFAIGTTTVTCSATDSDDSSSAAQATFMVHVEGAADQLAHLASEVTGVGRGDSLADKVARAQTEFASGHMRAVCHTLEAFIHEVRAEGRKRTPPSVNATLLADAQRIQAVIGCRCHSAR